MPKEAIRAAAAAETTTLAAWLFPELVAVVGMGVALGGPVSEVDVVGMGVALGAPVSEGAAVSISTVASKSKKGPPFSHMLSPWTFKIVLVQSKGLVFWLGREGHVA
jgi:hypothetical protein